MIVFVVLDAAVIAVYLLGGMEPGSVQRDKQGSIENPIGVDHDPLIELLSAALHDGARSSRIRADIESEAIARHIASIQYGMVATWIELGRMYSLVDADRTEPRLLTDAIVRRPRARRNR